MYYNKEPKFIGRNLVDVMQKDEEMSLSAVKNHRIMILCEQDDFMLSGIKAHTHSMSTIKTTKDEYLVLMAGFVAKNSTFTKEHVIAEDFLTETKKEVLT